MLKEGYEVRAFVRERSYQEHLKKLPVDIRHGDILNIDSIVRALDRVDTIFHTAAVYDLSHTDRDKRILETAVTGTNNLFEAASRKNAVSKIIYTSTAGTVGSTLDKNILLDESSYETGSHLFPYNKAKIDAENLALALAKRHNIYTVICNPSTIIGIDDYKLTPSNKMLLTFERFGMVYINGGHSLVNVQDAAVGHLSAMRRGKNLQRYILSGDNIQVRALIRKINGILNRRRPLIKLNRPLLYSIAFGLECLSKISGREPLLTRSRASKTVNRFSFYDNSRAMNELGFSPRPLDSYLDETLLWLIKRYPQAK